MPLMAFIKETILYTRPGCHLCDGVVANLLGMNVAYRPVNIDEDPELEQKYGLSIPVLYMPESGRELFFPFDEDQLRRFLQGGA